MTDAGVARLRSKSFPQEEGGGHRPLLAIEDLSVAFARGRGEDGGIQVLEGVNLSLEPGAIMALVGESGSGKTTLGMAILGLLPEESSPVVTGRIRLDEKDVVGASPEVLRELLRVDVGAVFQDPMTSLNPTMRIHRQLAEANRSDAAESEWLKRVGIADPVRCLRSFPHELSGGQRQRVMIAMAMSRRPKLVIADEPTTALDVTTQAQILALIRELCDEQRTAFIFITHDLAVATALSDEISVLYAGRVVERGATRAVAAAPGHPYTASLLSARFGLDAPRDRQLPIVAKVNTIAGIARDSCAFEGRCILATGECRARMPTLAPTRWHDGVAACLRPDSMHPKIWERMSADWPPTKAGPDEMVLEFSGVAKSYRRRGALSLTGRKGERVHALRGVSFKVRRGEAVAIVGESGSGKSTLLRIAAGSVLHDVGRVVHGGRDRPQIVFQAAAASLTPWLSVERQIGDRLRASEAKAGKRSEMIHQALERVGLPPALAKAMPRELSGGQAQRAAIARAIVVPPRLLLCDEAVSAMDISLAAATLNLLGTLRRELGMSMLFVTHDLVAARFIADRIIVLKDGEIVEEGEADSVVGHPTHAYTQRLVSDLPDHLHLASA